jgi:hypothetical protein
MSLTTVQKMTVDAITNGLIKTHGLFITDYGKKLYNDELIIRMSAIKDVYQKFVLGFNDWPSFEIATKAYDAQIKSFKTLALSVENSVSTQIDSAGAGQELFSSLGMGGRGADGSYAGSPYGPSGQGHPNYIDPVFVEETEQNSSNVKKSGFGIIGIIFLIMLCLGMKKNKIKL